MKKSLPIGISDFKKLRDRNCYYIDKTLMIKEVIDSKVEVILLPRPRRFGKTLNLSMLKYFFEKSENDYSYLFKDLDINNKTECMEYQGKYPVISLTFKDIKDRDWSNSFQKIKRLLIEEYERHSYIIECLSAGEQKYYHTIVMGEAEQSEYEISLRYLTKFLKRYHQENVMILIDEYDAPIQSGYLNGYYQEIISFMRNFLSGGLKDNSALEKGILTGILRVAKESIFSGLNNLSVYSLLKPHFNQYFGLLIEEVENFLNYYDLEESSKEVKEWYNGYLFGGETVYNPWSVIKYVENRGVPEMFWVNTSGNDLVKEIIAQGIEIKEDLELLLNNQSIKKKIFENIIYDEIQDNTDSIWSFFLFSGYLKAQIRERKRGSLYCELKIPNREVLYLFEDIIVSWFKNNIKNKEVNLLLKSLITGDITTFEKIFRNLVDSAFSYFDTSGNQSENFYHAFVLGLLVNLREDYQVNSNRESGLGRYDVMLIPNDSEKLGIVMEFKQVDQYEGEDLDSAVKKALEQIEEKNYRQELVDTGCQQILELGLAFAGKRVKIKHRIIRKYE